MNTRRMLWILFLVLFVVAAPAYAADIKATVAEVKDQRSTGQFFNDLEIKLKLLGDDAASIRGTKVLIKSAADDTGRNLLLPEEKKDRFETFDSNGTIDLKFRNPARRAVVVSEITGELQLFMPDKDPASTLLIKGFMKKQGMPINDPALAKAGISVTVLTKKEFESLKKEQEKKTKEAAKKEGLTGAMMSAVEALLGGFFQAGDNDLIFKISDPSGNIIDMDVTDAGGAKIQNHGSMKSGNDLIVLNYDEAMPADATLRLFLKTKKSVISVPLRLVDIALP
jgi:hypothetical protein